MFPKFSLQRPLKGFRRVLQASPVDHDEGATGYNMVDLPVSNKNNQIQKSRWSLILRYTTGHNHEPSSSEIILIPASAEDFCSFLWILKYFKVSRVAFQKRRLSLRLRLYLSALVRVFSTNPTAAQQH